MVEAARVVEAMDNAQASNFIQSAGWLSPDGKFYACPDTEHIYFADELAEHFYGSSYNGSRRLEEKDWLHIAGDGTVTFWHCDRPTQQHLDGLWALHNAPDDPERWDREHGIYYDTGEWKRHIRQAIHFLSSKMD